MQSIMAAYADPVGFTNVMRMRVLHRSQSNPWSQRWRLPVNSIEYAITGIPVDNAYLLECDEKSMPV